MTTNKIDVMEMQVIEPKGQRIHGDFDVYLSPWPDFSQLEQFLDGAPTDTPCVVRITMRKMTHEDFDAKCEGFEPCPLTASSMTDGDAIETPALAGVHLGFVMLKTAL